MCAVLKDPTRSFNCDVTCMLLSPGKEKVLAMMGSKDVHLVHKSSAKSGVTVLATTSASGWILPPFLVYPHERSQPWMVKDKMPPCFDFHHQKRVDDSRIILLLAAESIHSCTKEQEH